jgi:chromosome segregation ATPase
MATKKEKLEKKLQDVRAEIQELAIKLGAELRIPRTDRQNYSEARIHNLSLDLDKLSEKEDEAVKEYRAFISSDGYRNAVAEQVARMTTVINDLHQDAAQLKERLFELRNAAPGQILAGDDPLVIAGEVLAVREQLEATGEALSLAKLAIRTITKPPQVDRPHEPGKGELARFKEYLPDHF